MTLRLARVVRVHPEDNSVDLVMVDDGSRYVAVQVMAIGATTNTGLVDLPEPVATADAWGVVERTSRDATAVVDMLASTGVPIVVGFLFGQVNGMLFKEKNLRVARHASDVYSTINDAGDIELAHPSGTFVRIATSPGHVDRTGTDFDKRWSIDKNTSSAPNLCITVKNAGSQVAKVLIEPNGNVTVDHIGDLLFHTEGDALVHVEGNTVVHGEGTVEVDADGGATVVAPTVQITSPSTTCSGDLTVNGSLAVGGASVTHQGTSIGKTHKHSGVTTGLGNTGNPI